MESKKHLRPYFKHANAYVTKITETELFPNLGRKYFFVVEMLCYREILFAQRSNWVFIFRFVGYYVIHDFIREMV